MNNMFGYLSQDVQIEEDTSLTQPTTPVITLDATQQRIVDNIRGQHVIYSCPGSGKTRLISEAINHLIEKLNINPHSILAISFSRDASTVMKSRVSHEGVHISTIHSLCYTVLKEELRGIRPQLYPLNVCTGIQQKIMLSKLLEQHPDIARLYSLADVQQAIGYAKNRMIRRADGRITTRDTEMDALFYAYEKEKSKKGMIDYGDFCLLVLDIFDDPKKHHFYSNLYDYIFLDEGQDTSEAQYAVIKKLARDNILFCGDQFQSIFSFTGIRPESFVNLDKQYPQINKQYMVRNYRSANAIIQLANRMMDDMEYDHEKMVCVKKEKTQAEEQITDASCSCDGSVSYLGHFPTLSEEAATVADLILEQAQVNGKDNEERKDAEKQHSDPSPNLSPELYDPVMILYRTNWYAMEIELALRRRKVPYYISGNTSFFQFMEVKHMMAYLQLAYGIQQKDKHSMKSAFLEVFNVPNRYLGNQWKHQALQAFGEGKDVCGVLSSRFRTTRRWEYHAWYKHQQELLSHLQIMAQLPSPVEVIRYVRHQMGYDEWFKKEKLKGSTEMDLDIYESLNQFQSLCQDIANTAENMQDAFTDILKQQDMQMSKEGVCLSTIHRAKGSEARDVYVMGCTEGILPHIKNLDTSEELRLFYVAVTRAEENLYVSSATYQQYVNPSLYTHYLTEEEEAKEIVTENRIQHPE